MCKTKYIFHSKGQEDFPRYITLLLLLAKNGLRLRINLSFRFKTWAYQAVVCASNNFEQKEKE